MRELNPGRLLCSVAAAATVILMTFGFANSASASDSAAPIVYRSSLFSDVGFDSKFHTEIIWLAGHEITTGYADGRFRPKESVSRQAFAAFLYRLAGKPNVSLPPRSPFKDVKKTDQFYKEIVWLSKKGITTGYSNGTFKPGDKISREAISAFLYRFEGKPSFLAPPKSPFRDMKASSKFYKEVTWMSKSGMTTGYADGTFRPKTNVSREAIAAFLYRGNTIAQHDGTYRMGVDIAPGIYVAFQSGAQTCNWQRFNQDGDWLGWDFTYSGRTVAKLEATDITFVVENCTGWTPLEITSPNATSFGDGINAVGYHMKPGLYSAREGGGCEWTHLVGLGGSWDEKIEEGPLSNTPVPVRLEVGDALKTVNCGTWRRIGN